MKRVPSSCRIRLRKATYQCSQHTNVASLAFNVTNGVRQQSQHSSHFSRPLLPSGRSLSENRYRFCRPLLAPCISSARYPFSFPSLTCSRSPQLSQISARGFHSSPTTKKDEEEEEEICSVDQKGSRVLQAMLPLKPDLTPTGGLPPLPVIFSDALRTQVFTHRSFAARARHEFEDEPGEQMSDNEVLEFQGDAVLGLVVADLVRETYPRLRVGPCTKIRSLVIRNVTLADISLKYGIPSNIRLQRSQSLTLKASPNIQADTFEAYVGGLYIEQGLDVIRKWAKKLFLPYIEEAYRICREQHIIMPSPPPSPALNEDLTSTDLSTSSSEESNNDANSQTSTSENGVGHLSYLNQYLNKQKISYEWKFASIHQGRDNITPTWHAKLKVEDKIIATGRGTTKKLAQNEASKEALKGMGVAVP